jgi:hypothetical protein
MILEFSLSSVGCMGRELLICSGASSVKVGVGFGLAVVATTEVSNAIAPDNDFVTF